MAKKLIFLVVFFLSCGAAPNYSNIKVIEVIDGDTIKLSNGKLLRYIGMDTPEIRIKKGGKFVYSPQPFSLESKDFNSKLVQGKHVKVEFDVEKKDIYGRLLGYCFVDGVLVNSELIKKGYAVLYSRPPNIKYADEFVKNQKQARAGKKGLWADYEVISHLKAREYINQIKGVRGKVLNTYRSKKCTFLNFGKTWKTDFTVVIFNNVLDSFYEKDINPVNYYRGKIVEVTGRVREYNGPEIIVNSPYEIEVIYEDERK